MGVELAIAALDAGHAVVATGRETVTVAEATGERDILLVTELEFTSLHDAESATQFTMDRFGRINVLVNRGTYGA
ncbi:hypothetical protein V5735_22805 (plasmid) [Haladaptatus sp. SPP-AMP-3]